MHVGRGACGAGLQSCIGRSFWNDEPGGETKKHTAFARVRQIPTVPGAILPRFSKHEHDDTSTKGYNGTGVSLETGIGGGHGGKSLSTEFLHAIDQCHRGKGLGYKSETKV